MKTAMHILVAIIVLVVALAFILVYANTHPPRYPLHIPPSDYQVGYTDVSFTTSDGVLLKGWLIKPSQVRIGTAPAIVICHGVGANRSDFTDLAVSLSRRGYIVLTFDFRAHGESRGSRSSLGYHEQKDVAAAMGFLGALQEVDQERIGIYGFSMGGATAILSAAGTKEFKAVVADSAFASLQEQARTAITGFYHLPSFPFLQIAVLGYELYFQTRVSSVAPEAVIGRIAPRPVLLIAGDGDDLIPRENGERLYAAAKEPKELWIIPVSGHGYTVAAAGPEYEKRVGQFFDRHLR
jgi:dipeptidyl aminopeptidase/acylaminoacyl peptidase